MKASAEKATRANAASLAARRARQRTSCSLLARGRALSCGELVADRGRRALTDRAPARERELDTEMVRPAAPCECHVRQRQIRPDDTLRREHARRAAAPSSAAESRSLRTKAKGRFFVTIATCIGRRRGGGYSRCR